ncbi:MAG: sulfatase, partial [Bdellovibrio sp.]
MFGASYRLVQIFILVLWTLLFYTLVRAEFLIWNWSLFQNKAWQDILLAFVVGWRFDLSAVLSVTAPVILITFVPWPESWQKYWHYGVLVLFCLLH